LFELGNIEAEFQSGKIIVYQMKGEIKQILRTYPPLPEKRCPICMSSKYLESCHRGFLSESNNLVPSKLMIAGYYKKDEVDRLTEDYWKVRSLSTAGYSTETPQILEAVARLIIKSSNLIYTHIFCIPSRRNKKELLPLIAKNVSKTLGIKFLNPDEWINHNAALHEEKHVKEVDDFNKRNKLISELYKPFKKLENKLKDAKILLFDDLVQTGLTMNRIGTILVSYRAQIIHGFTWLRAVEGKILDVS